MPLIVKISHMLKGVPARSALASCAVALPLPLPAAASGRGMDAAELPCNGAAAAGGLPTALPPAAASPPSAPCLCESTWPLVLPSASAMRGSAAEDACALPVAQVTSRLATLLGGRVLRDACRDQKDQALIPPT